MSYSNSPTSILLLTGTIAPPTEVENLAVRSPVERLQQYRSAVRFYIDAMLASRSSYQHIVFAENSGANPSVFDDLAEAAAERFSFISCEPDNLPAEYDRGYREMRLLLNACENCATLSRALGDGATVWKATGRYKVLNISKVIRSSPTGHDLYVDLRQWPRPWCEMRVFGFKEAGLISFLRPESVSLKTGRATEEFLYHAVLRHQTISDGRPRCRISNRFKHELAVDGIRGGDGRNYLGGRNYLKHLFRSGLRSAVNLVRVGA